MLLLHLQMMRILAVIPVFNPEIQLLRNDIDAFADGVDTILLWQNSPLDLSALISRPWYGKLRSCGDGSNQGISKALNFAWRTARSEGFDAVLTMDQDSVWKGFAEFIAKISETTAPAGFYGPGINDQAFEGDFREAGSMLTSGMLIPVEVLDCVGGWNEAFAVDGVDNEFFFHARELGIKGWLTGGCALVHQLGKVRSSRFLGLRFRTYNYPPGRLYGIYRNNLAVIRKYPSAKEFGRQFRRNWFWRKPIRILLGEKDVCAKFKAIFRGIRDARRYPNA